MLMLLGGFLGFVFSQYLTSKSLQYSTPVYFSLILALSPVVVLILQAICFGEKITQKKWLELVSAFSTQRFLPFERLWKKDRLVRIISSASGSRYFGKFFRCLCRHPRGHQSEISSRYPDEMDF